MNDTIYIATKTLQDNQALINTITTKDVFEFIFLIINALILLLTIYVIRKSPSDAVKIGRQLNDAQQKDDAKRNLFLTLFSYRGSPVHRNFVDALNKIDVVFYDTPVVLDAWHKYYESLQQKNVTNVEDTWRILRTDLLSKMSISLGYNDLTQYDIEKHYYPEGHVNQNQLEWEFHYVQHQYYVNANEMTLMVIEQLKRKQEPKTDEPPK